MTNKKKSGLKKTLASLALAGTTFLGGMGLFRITHPSDPEKRYSAPQRARTYERVNTPVVTQPTTYTQTTTVRRHQKNYDKYELRAGVLMPISKESISEYEERRIRLEQQENRMRVRMEKHYRERLILLQRQGADTRKIEAVSERLEEYKQTIHYVSCYTQEGQKRLQAYNAKLYKTANVQQGTIYDF